jgi:tRNA-dihydrouridine synthase A
MLSEVDSALFGDDSPPVTRKMVLEQLMPYVESELCQGTSLHHITRHIMGLFQGVPGARMWRRALSAHPAIELDVLQKMIDRMPE